MAEPIIEPTPQPVDLAARIATLENANRELVAKRSKHKDIIAAHEATIGTRDATIAELQASLKQWTVDGPVNAMLGEIGVAGASERLRKVIEEDYRFDLVEGALSLVNASDGKPVRDEKGNVIPFEARSIIGALLATKDEGKRRVYEALLIVSRASGGAGNHGRPAGSTSTRTQKKTLTGQLGLR